MAFYEHVLHRATYPSQFRLSSLTDDELCPASPEWFQLFFSTHFIGAADAKAPCDGNAWGFPKIAFP